MLERVSFGGRPGGEMQDFFVEMPEVLGSFRL